MERPAPRQSFQRVRGLRLPPLPPLLAWGAVSGCGFVLLVLALLEVGPPVLGGIGAIVVSTAYTWALAVRTGGRPVIYGALALVLGTLVVVLDREFLRGGAAVLTAGISGVFAVMMTVPAVKYAAAVREVVIAVLIAMGGGAAVVGFEPVVSLDRFQYTALALGLVLATGLVYRLGAGLHGLGRRGLMIVLIGSAVLAMTLAYAEMLRRYGSPGLREAIDQAVDWTRAYLGAVPRPIQVLLGIPALAWGCHLRARRRQGWWICAFGVAATASVAGGLMNPQLSLAEKTLGEAYSLVLGLLVGYVVVRVDLAFTGPRGARARREEEAAAARPEPARMAPLL